MALFMLANIYFSVLTIVSTPSIGTGNRRLHSFVLFTNKKKQLKVGRNDKIHSKWLVSIQIWRLSEMLTPCKQPPTFEF